MKIKTYTKEELKNMQYDDIAYIILKEKGKKMTTAEIFKILCENLDLSQMEYENKIADFFTLLATEKRFIQLEKGYWDLKENHKIQIENETDDDMDEIEMQDNNDVEEEKEELYYDSKETDDDVDDGLQDLVVIDDIEDENEE